MDFRKKRVGFLQGAVFFFIFASDLILHSMKVWHFFLLLLLLFLSCRQRLHVETLSDRMPVFAEVYGMKDYHPDSAMRLMLSIADTLDESRLQRQSPFLFNEYQVLKTEIRYKNYLSLCDDTSAYKVYRFYDSLLSSSQNAARDEVVYFQFIRSLYYKAAVELHQDRMAEAYTDFLLALRNIDILAGSRQPLGFNRSNDEYEHFTALIYDRLAWFFYTYDQWEEALECLNLSNECFERVGSLQGIASNFELMGDVMLAQGDRYVSLDYYNKSDSIYEVLGVNSVFQHYRKVFHVALNLANDNKKKECNEMLIGALRESDDGSWLARQIHFMLGYSFLDGQVCDSALYHFEHSYPLLPRQTLKTYCNCITLANALDDSLKAAHYGQLLADFTLQQFYKKAEKAKMTASFLEYKKDKNAAKDKSLFLYIVGFIVLMVAIIAFQSFWIHLRQRRSKADLEQHERIKTSLEKQIAQTNVEVKLKEEKINALQLELEQSLANPDFQKLPFSEKMDVLSKIPISKRALKVLEFNVKVGVVYPELVMSESQLGQLVDAFDVVFPKFSVKIIEQYPRLKRSDVMYCCIYALGLSEIQAAILTGKTYQAVWKRSTKLHEIFGKKTNLQFILHDILKSW